MFFSSFFFLVGFQGDDKKSAATLCESIIGFLLRIAAACEFRFDLNLAELRLANYLHSSIASFDEKFTGLGNTNRCVADY